MKQKKKALHKHKDSVQSLKSEINLAYNKYFPVNFETAISYLLAGIAVLTGLFFLYHAKAHNGYICFPLDD